MNSQKSILKLIMALVLVSGAFYGCDEDDDNNNLTEENVLSGSITANKTLTPDVIWKLDGKVFVESGVTLTIQPGTIIKGKEGTGTVASALVITRGAKIDAQGTASSPIIFTTVLDNIEIGQKSGTNLSENDRQKWGGLIVLGNATISAKDGDTETQIEGVPANEGNGRYGGSDDADNSGIIRYVSIRHGGALIGEGNEINGLTLGGVGTGTEVNFIEVVGNLDDGIELFGGSVDVNNALVAYQGDDAFDIDQNYSGTLSNIYAVHGPDTDNALEIDGPEGSTHNNGKFTIHNGTFISKDGSGRGGTYKSKAQGTIHHSYFSGYSNGKWQRIRANFDEGDNCADKADTYTYFTNGSGDFTLINNTYNAAVALPELISAYTDFEDSDACSTTDELSQSYQDAVDNTFTSGTNVLIGTSGNTDRSVFDDWTWTDINNKW